uniref:Putative ribonuclease H-like domain-containing protein n=1 Tax=Tanacetum cinerariifolium TaxID=118510 RepID=A0A699GX43_TANCI|nr:putative ribonuclease H-like domain-containing protein [Tanacetum cinerariifolium]GEX13582.1 putative ribonuclease H-like domain-containing protein [Tanacetum cinerariifolium]
MINKPSTKLDQKSKNTKSGGGGLSNARRREEEARKFKCVFLERRKSVTDGAKGEQVPNHVVKKGNLEFLVCKHVANHSSDELVDKERPLKRKMVLQKLINQLEIHGESISQEDVNKKFLRSLSPEWNTHTIVWRNKLEIDTLRLDDLYNNLKINKTEVKGTSSSNTNTSNIAFVSSNSTSGINGAVNTAYGVSTASTQAIVVNSTTIDNLKEMDLRWQMVMLTIRARRFLKNIKSSMRKTLWNDIARLVPNKVKYYNCHKRGHFARECKAPRSQDTKHKESTRRTVPVETPASAALVSCDDLGGYDWSDQAKDGPANFALNAYSSTSSNSEVFIDSNCSSFCLENTKILKEQNKQLLKDLRTSKINAITYKTGLEYVEASLLVYKKNKSVYKEDIKILKREIYLKEVAIIELMRKLELAQKQKDEIQLTVENFKNSSKNLSKLLDCQIIDKCKTGLGYNAVSPPYTGNFLPPKPNLSGLKEFVNEPIVSEPIVKKPVVKTSKAKASADNPKDDKGVIDSGCLRHMTENMSYLTDYEEIDEGYVAFGEAVNTGCYVQNRVLVVKPPNKTPCELFHGRTPPLSFMRPFGFVTILNTKDHLGKFDGKADEGFFIRYSLNSKAFRVFNNRTRIVEENLHIRFNENTPNIARSRPNWLFYIDELTKSMNYKPVVARNHSNGNAGTKACDDVGKARMKTVPGKDYILLPLWTIDLLISQESKSSQDDGFQPLNDDGKKVDEDPRQESKCKDQEKEDNVNSTNNVNVVGINEEADMNNMDITIQVGPTSTIRIYKDHPLDQLIGDLHSTTQTRNKSNNLEDHGIKAIRLFLAYASFKDFVVYHMDVKSAFLYRKIKEEDEDDEEVDVHMYRSMIGSLLYLTSSRLDIMLVVCACARYHVNPKVSHIYAVKKIFRYLKGQPKFDLWYPKDSHFDLVAYTDSDYAGASLDRKSTTEGCQFLGCRLISWQCKKQTVVANSTTKAEYATVKAKTVNGEGRLQDLVDAKKIIITESTIRRDLQLEDAKGVDCLPNAVISEQLTIIGKLRREVTKVPQPSDPESVADEAVNEVMNDTLLRAAITDTNLDAEQDRDATTPTISINEATLAQALAEIKHAKPKTKAKGIVFHEPGELQAKKQRELNDEEKANMFMQLLEKRRKFFAAKKVEERRNKPPIQAQQRKIMCTYLKNIEGKKLTDLKNKSFDSIQKMFDRAFKRINTFVDYKTELVEESSKKHEANVTEGSSKRAETELEQENAKKQKIDDDKETGELQQLVKIIPDEEGVEIDAIPLAVKPLSIVDWKI